MMVLKMAFFLSTGRKGWQHIMFSLWCHCNITMMSMWCNCDVTMMSLQPYCDATVMSLWCHCEDHFYSDFSSSSSLGIPMLPCALELSICQTVWWLWPVPLARICENLISNHRTRRDGKTMTRTMWQTEACSSFVRIQHGCSRSEALFRCSCGQCSRYFRTKVYFKRRTTFGFALLHHHQKGRFSLASNRISVALHTSSGIIDTIG